MKKAIFFIGMFVHFITEKQMAVAAKKQPYLGGGNITGIIEKEGEYQYEIMSDAQKLEIVPENKIWMKVDSSKALTAFQELVTPKVTETEKAAEGTVTE